MDVGYPAGPLITTVGLCGLLASEYGGWKPGVWLFKPWASTGFMVTAYTSPQASTPLGQALLASLALSFAGDVLLIPGTPGFFTAGLGAFLLAHVGFAYAFAARGLDTNTTLAAAAGGAVLAAAVWRWLRPNLPPADVVPVALYTTVISGMTATAIGSAWSTPAPWWQIAGAVVFQLSDLCVARQQFVAKSFANPAVGLPLYYFAQQVIASLLWF
jgi:uncharacterized membrane protein YhhN